MSVWLAIGLVVGGLGAVAVAILMVDVARGDVGGGHHTMARARRLLVVSTDEPTRREADRWIDQQRLEHPERQFFVLSDSEGQGLYMAIEDVVERERPDAIVVARHADDSHSSLEGLYGRLKEGQAVPVDAIFVGQAGAR